MVFKPKYKKDHCKKCGRTLGSEHSREIGLCAFCDLSVENKKEEEPTVDRGIKNVERRKKLCAVCGEPVERGEGMHYARRLIHRKCRKMAGLQYHRLIAKKFKVS